MENPGTNRTIGRNHQRKGEFRKVGENLYRYSTSGTYYAVFRVQGKLIWKSLKTDDRELANRKLKDEKEKKGRIDADAAKMTLSTLLDLYEKRLQQYDAKTIETRAWILKTFRETWRNGLEIPVRAVTKAQLDLWLAPHRARLAKSSFNELVLFVRQLTAIENHHHMSLAQQRVKAHRVALCIRQDEIRRRVARLQRATGQSGGGHLSPKPSTE